MLMFCNTLFSLQKLYFLTQTVHFMYFVLISEQLAIISLQNINWLVSFTETECVYCAVWFETNIILFVLILKGPNIEFLNL